MKKGTVALSQNREYLYILFPRATSQADMLACPFGDCRESQMPRHLREYLECRLQNNEM